MWLKGCAMGTADVVPGVSGGTIAFISGIYEELIESIRRADLTALRLLGRLRFGEFWRHVNGRFLLPVLLGIATAVFSLARLMTYLLTNHPVAVWAFFFGLIVASALLVARQVGKWDWRSAAALLAGIAVAWWITVASPAETPETWWFIMLSGAIAICAMILPGISGAFILLLLGKYQFILQAVGELNIPVLALFLAGAVAGIVSFSHLLSWLLRHWHDVTVATLMGFMIGSLVKPTPSWAGPGNCCSTCAATAAVCWNRRSKWPDFSCPAVPSSSRPRAGLWRNEAIRRPPTARGWTASWPC